MRNDSPSAQRIYRKDYQPPNWAVETVELYIDLCAAADDQGAHPMEVRCTQQLRALGSGPTDLVLDGRDMELLSIAVDGQTWPEEHYELGSDQLTIRELPASATLTITGRITPFANASLEGLYASPGLLCTQCEAHGFSRITWFMDRPDVLSRYRVELRAPSERYPVLLANGNRVEQQDEAGIRRVVWEDPYLKPCYLFAMVAGDLGCVRDSYTTGSGREVAIEFWCDRGLESQLDHAVASLKNAMHFDEQEYGREYDLDLYMVVVARAFNMGAMENKGLNIFNPKCVLAHPRTATDEDHILVEAVVAHEYLHNWTGNRITCRDWFQLSLKEGLTVYREQHFSALHGGGAAQRIHEVDLLRSRQFVEDAGPLSHPVRPDSYVDMNNFYTVTVYEKGAELIRVLRSLVGERGFAAGMQTYFERFDGQAVTLEDLLSCFRGPHDEDLTAAMLRWYDQAGTPQLELRLSVQSDTQIQLELEQSPPRNNAQFEPVPIPVELSFVDSAGILPLAGAEASGAYCCHLREAKATTTLSLSRPAQGPVTPILGGGFPAPVRAQLHWSFEQKLAAARSAPDLVARWEAMQALYREAMDAQEPASVMAQMQEVISAALQDDVPADVQAALLSPPPAASVLADSQDVDPNVLPPKHDALERALAAAVWSQPKRAEKALDVPSSWRFVPADVAARKRALRLLQLGLKVKADGVRERALEWLRHSDNLSQRFGALAALWSCEDAQAMPLWESLWEEYAHDELVLDRVLGLRARYAKPDEWPQLLQHPGYKRTAPNRVRAVLDTLLRHNLSAFYSAANEQARQCWMEEIVALDGLNPQLTARLITGLETRLCLNAHWQDLTAQMLQSLRQRVRSPAVHEQIGRLLKSAD
nr:aminopeptidase N [Oceanococcus sp. HetDA_MAG_MS8]